MKSLLFISFLILTLTSCLGPRKINKWVAKHYNEIEPTPAPKKNAVPYISVTSPLLAADGPISVTEKKTTDLLPLLFYWQWDYKNTCTLNPKIPIDHFTTEIIAYANRKGLRQKLNGERVELSVENIPNVFAIDVIPAFSRTLTEAIFSTAQPASILCSFNSANPKSRTLDKASVA